MKLVTILGARPQFIKAAALSKAISELPDGGIDESIVHTGQHFDENMSKVFFDELDIPPPRYNLGIHGGQHGAMTGQMLEAIEPVLIQERPDWVLVYGDTNSTLAGALAAAKLQIPLVHVEAGLRSFNRRMPEEINRVIADRLSSLLFCPGGTAVDNLKAEGITAGVHSVGDIMFDVALNLGARAPGISRILSTLELAPSGFALATCHRAENTESPERLREILSALVELAQTLKVLLPLHPGTLKQIRAFGLEPLLDKICVLEPLAFMDMAALLQSAALILTDSGGVQKEAFFYGVPCITLRDETEWVETVELGWNRLAGAKRPLIVSMAREALVAPRPGAMEQPYGDGHSAQRILSVLMQEARARRFNP